MHFLLILSVLFLLILLVFGQKIQQMLLLYAPAAAAVTGILLKFRVVILFFFLIFFFAFIYKMLPNRRAVFFSQLFGAAGCSAAWYIFSFGLSVYINYFHGFSLYGSLTAIVLLMFWLYIGLYIFLICGEANNAFEIVWLQIQTKRKKQRDAKKEKRNDSDF